MEGWLSGMGADIVQTYKEKVHKNVCNFNISKGGVEATDLLRRWTSHIISLLIASILLPTMKCVVTPPAVRPAISVTRIAR